MRQLSLKMSFYDDWGKTYAIKAVNLPEHVATCGFRGDFTNITPPSVLSGTQTMDEVIKVLECREFRRKELIAWATNLGRAIANHLEDSEGWHGLDRQDRIQGGGQ